MEFVLAVFSAMLLQTWYLHREIRRSREESIRHTDRSHDQLRTDFGKSHDQLRTDFGKSHDQLRTDFGKSHDQLRTDFGNRAHDQLRTDFGTPRRCAPTSGRATTSCAPTSGRATTSCAPTSHERSTSGPTSCQTPPSPPNTTAKHRGWPALRATADRRPNHRETATSDREEPTTRRRSRPRRQLRTDFGSGWPASRATCGSATTSAPSLLRPRSTERNHR